MRPTRSWDDTRMFEGNERPVYGRQVTAANPATVQQTRQARHLASRSEVG